MRQCFLNLVKILDHFFSDGVGAATQRWDLSAVGWLDPMKILPLCRVPGGACSGVSPNKV